MNNTNLSVGIISNVIKNLISEIENKIGCKILFGAVGGSYSLGLQNKSSDIDFYLIVDNEQLLKVVHKKIVATIWEEQIVIDLMCVSYKEVLNEIEKYNKRQKKYPTVVYRTEDERVRDICKGDVDRSDFKRSILFRILLSDEVIGKDWVKSKYSEFIGGIRIIDIIDYHYTRIYGNYKERIMGQDFILVRKYLYIVHQICTCKCLMDSAQRPPMDFIKLINSTISNDLLKERVYILYKKNQSSYKDKNMELTYKDEIINQFIIESMNKIMTYLMKKAQIDEYLCFD